LYYGDSQYDHCGATPWLVRGGMIKILTEPVYFLGQVEFKVLNGSVSVNGRIYNSSSKSEWSRTYSPRSSALMSIEPQGEAEIEFRALENGLEVIQNCQPTFANIFQPEAELSESFEEVVKGFHVLRQEIDLPLLRISEEWKEALGDLKSFSGVPVIFICGHRKVGKSSFSRFLVNGLLNDREEVELVDLDPGQTEFTPAGFVARKSFTNKGKQDLLKMLKFILSFL
jgi:hypothetical protein